MEQTGPDCRSIFEKGYLSFCVLAILTWLLPVYDASAGTVAQPPGPATHTVAEFYEKASPVNDPGLPDGLRVSRWAPFHRHKKVPPVITSQCLRFSPGEFSRLFFHSPHARRLRELFVEQGTDAGKLSRLVAAHSHGRKEIVTIFDEGYMIIFDDNEPAAFIFPVGANMGEKVFLLTR